MKARDSVACLLTQIWLPTGFRTIDVSDPSDPRLAGTCRSGAGVALALRDSLAYVAEDCKLEIFSIANPRNPRLVGSCALPNISTDLWVRDTLVFVSPEVRIINVVDPAHPVLVSYISGFIDCAIAVRDTLAYLACAGNQDSLAVWSVADPLAPYHIYSVSTNGLPWDVELAGNQVYVGCQYGLQAFDISDPVHPVEIGRYATPDQARRVFFDGTYIYAACFGGGVCIFETVSTGVAERGSDVNMPGHPQIDFWPNPASSIVSVHLK